jgi:hypothetical protein
LDDSFFGLDTPPDKIARIDGLVVARAKLKFERRAL